MHVPFLRRLGIFGWIGLAFIGIPFGQNLRIGKPAPKIEIAEWVGPAAAETGMPAGRAVVLDFWATWCSPCREAIPHLNSLAEALSGNDVVFVAVTAEKREVVEAFLKQKPIAARVGLDPRGTVFQAFGVRLIPQAFVISGDGTLLWQGSPITLSKEQLAKLIKEGAPPKKVDTQTSADVTSPTPEERTDTFLHPLFSVTFAPADGEEADGWMRVMAEDGQRITEYRHMDLLLILSDLTQTLLTRVRVTGEMKKRCLDGRILLPDDGRVAERKFQAALVLCSVCGVEMSQRKEERTLWRLTVPDPAKLKVSAGEGRSYGPDGSDFVLTGTSLPEVARCLEMALNRAIARGQATPGAVEPLLFADETGLGGRYDVTFPVGDFTKTRQVLAEQYGIVLKPVTREIEILQISPR